ncbi:MAG: YkgJ family cysteine cluster protein [Phycisphaerae bacterium]|nr:MAG: YkgJ family cysteine cluster protein [Planctomycetota bacterium]KAB2944466.1 MAG: YkgJ family cysteine cluster protein [Phycisphaerae bacterium]MCK6464609.1 YkgJ family cysteine cluster protein [Phycisphaerae bacterium]NUQ08271.1 YkgJ family cysteine cluster protein [Phycisphaerae bacterium]
MSTTPLPILMPQIPGQRWSCHTCGRCCYDLVGHLSAEERARIDRQDWRGELGIEPYVRLGRSTVLNKHADGACVFLDRETNLCRIHARFGEQAKPLACRIYPFTVRPVPQGWRVALRFDCPSAAGSRGEALAKHRPFLGELVGALPHLAWREDVPRLTGSDRLSEIQTQRLTERLLRMLDARDEPLTWVLRRAAEVATTLAEARLDRVGVERFDELSELLFSATPGGSRTKASVSPRARAMLRQLVYAFAAHATIHELRAGFVRRFGLRFRHLRDAGRFRRGRGDVPATHGLPSGVAFDQVDAVRAADDPNETERIEDLARRYLTGRVASRSVFGAGYYDWPVVDGLLALWASAAAWGYLARHRAAAQGRAAITYDDAFEALRMLDRSATRSPVLGTRTEKMRLRYLARTGALPGLVEAYALVT